MINVAALWRHPIKSHGRETLQDVTLRKGHTMPWDRHWAVAHDRSKFDPDVGAWMPCRNFMIGASSPALAGTWASFDPIAGIIQLRHADIGEISFAPDNPDDVARFLAWIAPLTAGESFTPMALVKATDRGMTDTDYPTLSILTKASHDAVASYLGHPLEMERWRGNIWLDGPAAWEELNWVGKTLQIGTAELQVVEPIERCKHTLANPETGKRDVDTLAALRDGWNHQDFGVYATVTNGGKIAVSDKVKVL